MGPKAKINRMRKENTYTLKLESHLIPFINPDDAEMVYTRIMAVMTRISMTLLLGMPVILEMPPATEKAPVDREPAIPAQRMKMHRASMASESLPLIAFSPTSG